MSGAEAGSGGGAGVLTRADLDAFCLSHYRRLVGMLGLYCGDGDVGEELAQEALVRLCRNWSQLPTQDDASRWLTRVALNLAKSSFRTRAARRRVLERYSHVLDRRPAQRDEASILAVRAAVANLPARQREVIVLRYYCDLPIAEVATLLGRPAGTVKSLTSQAVDALRRSGLEVARD